MARPRQRVLRRRSRGRGCIRRRSAGPDGLAGGRPLGGGLLRRRRLARPAAPRLGALAGAARIALRAAFQPPAAGSGGSRRRGLLPAGLPRARRADSRRHLAPQAGPRGRGRCRAKPQARAARFAFFEAAMARRGDPGPLARAPAGRRRGDDADAACPRQRSRRTGGTAARAARGRRSESHLRPLLDLKKAEIVGGPARRRHRLAGGRDATRAGIISATGSAVGCCRRGTGRRAGTPSAERPARGSCWRRTTRRWRPGSTGCGR